MLSKSFKNLFCVAFYIFWCKYFDLRYIDNSIKETWGWIGVDFDEIPPMIYILFENNDGWGKPICDIIPDNNHAKSLQKGEYYSCAYYDGGHLWFELSDEKHKEFSNAPDLNSQIEILKSFVDEVVRLPLKLLQSKK